MSWKILPIAFRVVPWEKVLKHAPKIVEEARKFYDANAGKKDEKQQAELMKDMANQLEALTGVIAMIRVMVIISLFLSIAAIVLAIVNLIKLQ